MVSKRILSGVVGVLAVLAALVAIAYAIQLIEDFTNPDVPLRLVILGEFIMCSMAFAALIIGIGHLRFSISGRNERSKGWARQVALGIGTFFPGFLFSLPLTVVWASHTWPGDGQSGLAALEVSCYIGGVVAIICSIVLVKGHAEREETRGQK